MVRERRGVNKRVRGAIGDVPDGGTGQVERRQVGEARGTGCAGRAVEERLVTLGNDVVSDRQGDDGLELSSGGDVHTPLGDPGGLEAAGGANVEIGEVVVDEGLVGRPAGVGGGDRGDEVAGVEEVVGLDEMEALDDVLAGGGVVGGGEVPVGRQLPQDGEVERAGGVSGAGGGSVSLRDDGGDGGEEEEEEEEEEAWEEHRDWEKWKTWGAKEEGREEWAVG